MEVQPKISTATQKVYKEKQWSSEEKFTQAGWHIGVKNGPEKQCKAMWNNSNFYSQETYHFRCTWSMEELILD